MQKSFRGDRLNIFLALGLLMIVSLGLFNKSSLESGRLQAASNVVVSSEQRAMLCSLEDAFSAIAERVKPGVVSITAVQTPSPSGGLSKNQEAPGFMEDFLNRLLEGNLDYQFDELQGPGQRDDPVTAAGSGAIVRRQGNDFYVLTNYHLVEGAYQVNVRLEDDTVLKGIVIGTDPSTDLGVVRISSSKLTDAAIIPLGDSSRVKVGSWALAVGSPYGFAQTLTVGVVSALNRELDEGETMYLDLIQTDAAINKGNSGGPLLDVEGRVIGINTAIASPTGGFIGLGFAIPINTAKAVLDQLIIEGRVVRGWLGVSVQELTPVLQEYYGVRSGVLVASVDGKGPAAGTGITGEDIIIRIGSTPVSDVYQLQRLIAGTKPGTVVPITLTREGKEHSANVKVGLSPLTPAGRPSPPPVRENAGIRVRTLTDEIAKKIEMRGTKGVIIIGVAPSSPAEDAGLEEGDIVVGFNGRAVSSESEFMDMLQNVRPGGIVVLKTIRKNLPRMIGFRFE